MGRNHIYQQYLEGKKKKQQTKANIRNMCGIKSIYKLVIISLFLFRPGFPLIRKCSETIGKCVRYLEIPLVLKKKGGQGFIF